MSAMFMKCRADHVVLGAVVLVAGMWAGCSLEDAGVPALTSPSGFSTAVTLTASPARLPRDGTSQSIVTVTVRDASKALRRFEYNDSAVNSRPQPYEIKGFRPVARSQDEDDSMAACAGPAFGEGLLDGGNARAPDGTAKAVPAGSRRRSGRVIRETHVRNIKS